MLHGINVLLLLLNEERVCAKEERKKKLRAIQSILTPNCQFVCSWESAKRNAVSTEVGEIFVGKLEKFVFECLLLPFFSVCFALCFSNRPRKRKKNKSAKKCICLH